MRNLYIILTVMCLLVLGCTEDKGNYEYVSINEVEFDNIDEEYSVLINSTILDIDPVIKMSEGINPDAERFKYEWICVAPNGDKYLLATTRTVSTLVNLPIGTYTLYLKVRDSLTDLLWMTYTSLTVGTIYTRGIMLIGEDEYGYADAQMISIGSDTTIIRNILKNCGLPVLKGPIAFIHTGRPYSSSYDVAVKVWVMTASGSYWLDRESMLGTTENHVKKIIYSSAIQKDDLCVVDIAPQVININGLMGNNFYRAMVTSNGLLFTTSMGTNKDNYLDPVNRLNSLSTDFLPAFPFMFYPLKDFYGLVWYDTANNRFLRVTNSSTCSYELVDNPGEPFPWNQGSTGRTLIYGENTYNKDGGKSSGNSFALMKDQLGNYFIYKMYAYGSRPEKIGAYQINLNKAVGFSTATKYAFSSLRTLLFYVADNKLYAYDYDPGNEKLYTLDVGDGEITMVKFDTQIDPDANALYVATYDNINKGTLVRYSVNRDPNRVTITADKKNTWSGLTKIKNMSWRAVK